MAVIPPSNAINRILAALGLENVRSLTLSASVNSAVAVVTEQYATGSQMDDLAAALETKDWVLVSKDEYESLKSHKCRWGSDPSGPHLSDEYLESLERGLAFEEKVHSSGVIDLNLLYPPKPGVK